MYVYIHVYSTCTMYVHIHVHVHVYMYTDVVYPLVHISESNPACKVMFHFSAVSDHTGVGG